MIVFINKYKRWICLFFAIVSIIMLFIPATIIKDNQGNDFAKMHSTSELFNRAHNLLKQYKNNPEHMKDWIDLIASSIIGCIFIVVGIGVCCLSLIFINKPIPYSLSYILLSLACVIKMGTQFAWTPFAMSISDSWTDYVIITIALLMLIVDIVRLSLYIRAHKDAIHSKAADISARLKTKLQSAHKPTKDERIAELEERVKQLENKQDE